MSGPETLTCAELVELVTDALECRLPEDEHVRFEQHLVLCTGCRTNVEQMRTTIALVDDTQLEEAAPGEVEELLVAFRGWKAARTGGSS